MPIGRRIDGVAAARALFAGIAAHGHEVAAIAYLCAQQRLLGLRYVRGGHTAVAVSPRTIAFDALAFGARGVVMAHNHPSGDPKPSGDDVALVKRLARALEAIEVRLVDHLVLAGPETTSLRAMGLL